MADNNYKSVELWFVRHGETLFNVKGLVQGWCDSPLTNKGKEDTEYLGKILKLSGINFKSIYSSDLTRCLETSVILQKKLENDLQINQDKRLRELNTGIAEGDLIEEHLLRYPEALHFKKYKGITEGETWNDLFFRLNEVVTEIGEKHKVSGGKILVVSHTLAITALMGLIDSSIEQACSIPNNSVTIFEYKDGRLFLKNEPNSYF
ncbi:hypothetical protein FUSO7_12570 [Fusobacterium necrophorum BFTR-2]|nr:histidine phosphatase family protein [Fusobacterium necrophorum]KDE68855.1 hypothetical protein FUSO7_12570 [Fusobacterium necrophorum BFTR-2]